LSCTEHPGNAAPKNFALLRGLGFLCWISGLHDPFSIEFQPPPLNPTYKRLLMGTKHVVLSEEKHLKS